MKRLSETDSYQALSCRTVVFSGTIKHNNIFFFWVYDGLDHYLYIYFIIKNVLCSNDDTM